MSVSLLYFKVKSKCTQLLELNGGTTTVYDSICMYVITSHHLFMNRSKPSQPRRSSSTSKPSSTVNCTYK